MEEQTPQNAIEAPISHLNGFDGEILPHDQKIENRGTEMLFLQGYMRKQNGIKNTTVWSHRGNAGQRGGCDQMVVYILYE